MIEDDECPPTIPSERMPTLVPLARPVDVDLLAQLKRLVELAEKGEVLGMTILANHGHAVSVWHGGEISLSDELICFEDYKFKRMFDRNIKQT
jgi:hypothetical protein